MKIKNKGKVYPSPSSSSSSSSSVGVNRDGDVLSVLNLLPAAILALAFILSLEDREVLAYMITRSMKTTTTNPSFVQESKKKSPKKPTNNNNHNHNHTNHKTPVFDCDCFDCYTSYWFRWDSSPNRELIHQAIEAFEDHLTNGEQSRKNTRAKRRDKTGRRVGEKPALALGQQEMSVLDTSPSPAKTDQSSVVAGVSLDDDVSPAVKPEKTADRERLEEEDVEAAKLYDEVPEAAEETVAEETAVVTRTHVAVSNHKGLARKVLPDVLGLLNSRLWSLWSPNV